MNYGSASATDNRQAPMGDFPTEEPVPSDPLDIQLPGVAFESDADEIEQAAEDNKFLQIEKPGTYRLRVVKIAKAERGKKTVFLNGKSTFFDAWTITVIFGDARDIRHQISDQFVLPATTDRSDLEAYNKGTTKNDGKYVGFYADKTGHFLSRLVGGFGKGQAIPPFARDMRNWLGRDVLADVLISKRREKGKDSKTGEMTYYEPRPQVDLFSYRTAPPLDGQAPAPQEQESTEPTGAPPQQQAQPSQQAPRTQAARRGAHNI